VGIAKCIIRTMSEIDDQDFRGWRFEPQPSREAILERRVKELENIVAQLQRDIRSKGVAIEEPREGQGIHTVMGTIGKLRGTLVQKSNQ